MSTYPLAHATNEAKRTARVSKVHMAIVWEKDEYGEGYGWCPMAALDLLYGPQIRHGLAKLVDEVGTQYAARPQAEALRCFPGILS